MEYQCYRGCEPLCQRGGVAYIECATPHEYPATKGSIVVIKVYVTDNACNKCYLWRLVERLPVGLPGVASGLLRSTDFWFFRVKGNCRVEGETSEWMLSSDSYTMVISVGVFLVIFKFSNVVSLGRVCRSCLRPYPRYISPTGITG